MIHHGGTETRRKLLLEDLTQEIIGAAIEFHRELGPGLLESACEEFLCHELHLRGLSLSARFPCPCNTRG
jgi:GxxExxY protein